MGLHEQYAEMQAARKKAFYGKTYWYNTASHGRRPIGVCQGLGMNIWIVAFIKDNGSRRSINTLRLPANECPEALQKMLDDWAAQRGLEEVA